MCHQYIFVLTTDYQVSEIHELFSHLIKKGNPAAIRSYIHRSFADFLTRKYKVLI